MNADTVVRAIESGWLDADLDRLREAIDRRALLSPKHIAEVMRALSAEERKDILLAIQKLECQGGA